MRKQYVCRRFYVVLLVTTTVALVSGCGHSQSGATIPAKQVTTTTYPVGTPPTDQPTPATAYVPTGTTLPVTADCGNRDLAEAGQVTDVRGIGRVDGYTDIDVKGVGVTSSGNPYIVFGGATDYDSSKGLLLVSVEPKNECDPNTVGSPESPTYYTLKPGSGAITGLSGLGQTLTVSTEKKQQFMFNLSTGTFAAVTGAG